MIDADALAEAVGTYLRSEVEAASYEGHVQMLMPVSYPDCDAVSIFVEQLSDGAYAVSDHATGDSYLIGYLGERSAAEKAAQIAARFEVDFQDGRVVARAGDQALAERCWQVAQASAAIASGVSFVSAIPTPKRTFSDILISRVSELPVTAKTNVPVAGASGHEHRATVFIEETEAIVEPISGRKSWERAERVYAQFGDLRGVNGFRLLAVLDDRDRDVREHRRLLSQVGQVGSWSQADNWLESLST